MIDRSATASDTEAPPADTVDDTPEDRLAAARPDGSYVLVVDDDALVREFLSRCLAERGYGVKQAANAAEAFETMLTKPASLILCDIRMPGHDGLWLTERLRAHWPDAPVVMVTALDDLETIQQSRELGAADYVTKPIKPDRLLQVVRRAIKVPREPEPQAEESKSAPLEPHTSNDKMEAEYMLEYPARCPACGERLTALKAVRLIRTHVNFTSTLPRRGRVTACPHCLAIIPAELTNF